MTTDQAFNGRVSRTSAINTIYFHTLHNDVERRERLCNGQIFLFSPYPSALALAIFAREIVEGPFARFGCL
jgi:hypothetical protein